MIYVQFDDETKKVIVSWFATDPRERSEEPNLGSVKSNNLAYRAYYECCFEDIRKNMPQPTAA
jgi:hypothetical protein